MSTTALNLLDGNKQARMAELTRRQDNPVRNNERYAVELARNLSESGHLLV